VPIATDAEVDEGGHPRYADVRLRRLAEYLTTSELTQCAHRNRPLRYDRRTVVTLCKGEIDYLPVTETITWLPRFSVDGTLHAVTKREQDRLACRAAEERLRERGADVTIQALASEAHVATQTAQRYRDERRRRDTPPRVSDSP
jgi:hypothetical protein